MGMTYHKMNTELLREAKLKKLELQNMKITDEFQDVIAIILETKKRHPFDIKNKPNYIFDELCTAISDLKEELMHTIAKTSELDPIPDDKCSEAYQLALRLKTTVILVTDETIDLNTKKNELDSLQQFTRGGLFSPEIIPLIKGIISGLLYIAISATFFLATGMLMLDGGFASFCTSATIFGGGLGTLYQTKQYETNKIQPSDIKTDKVVRKLRKFLDKPKKHPSDERSIPKPSTERTIAPPSPKGHG